jgi:hypothetical protein
MRVLVQHPTIRPGACKKAQPIFSIRGLSNVSAKEHPHPALRATFSRKREKGNPSVMMAMGATRQFIKDSDP